MIDFKGVTKSFSGTILLDNASFRVNTGDRVGMVGPNGAGKSTIFGIITGEILPERGTVSLPKDSRVGLLRQQLPKAESGRSLLAFTADAIPELRTMTAELHELETLMEQYPDADETPGRLKRHGFLQSAIEQLGSYRLEVEAERALSNLGFKEASFNRPLTELSGGWRMRAALARTLISRPDILLLDEPSNYLDIPAVEWLCKFLKSYTGTLLLISHDRFLLRKLTGLTLEVNAGKVTSYAGNYDFYRAERVERLRILEAAKRNNDRKKEHLERGIDRFRAKSSKAAQAKSWRKALDRIEDIDLPDALEFRGAIRFPAPPPSGAEAFRFEDVCFGYDRNRPALLDKISLSVNSGEKIAFIGYNGTGKTTILKLLTGTLTPWSGRVVTGHHCVIGYQSQEFADLLVPEQTVYDTVRGNLPAGAPTGNLLNILGSFGFSGDAAQKPCKVLSGGEKIRLLFARIFVNPPNLLVLDEPTTHLDIAARELLQQAICDYPGTVCLVSHDIEFVRGTANVIIAMESPSIRKYFGNYDYYLEKSAELKAPTHDEPPAANAANDLARDRRRARAQAREAISGRKREAQKTVDKLEAELDQMEKRRSELVSTLSGNGKVDFPKVSRELADIQKKIEHTMKSWETAAENLEAILRENLEIHKD